MKKYGKGFLAALMTLIFVIGSLLPVYAEETDPLTLESKSAVLMDAGTGKVLYEKNSHEAMPPASVTKVMTMLLIYEAEEAGQFKWEDSVQVSEHAASMGGSQVFLEPGENQTAADMTKCIAIASANDAAVAMAEFVAGSEEAFVERMNKKAEELGMQETHFVNACGLDVDGHETSAYDIALMSRELMTRFPEIQEYTTTWQDTIVHKTRKGESEFGLTNTNKLIKWYEGATGLKTGSTGKALYCLSGTAERNGLHLIGVVMAAPDFKVRFQETMKLLDYGFANFSAQKGLPAGQEMAEIPVTKGMKNTVPIIVKEEISMLLKKDAGSDWETRAETLPGMDAPVAAGEKAGELVYLINGEEVGRTDLVTAETVEKANINTMLQRMLRQWF
ncbi:D-alanyl-D-alanine carboxypeptidase family protein [Anaerotignum sp.]|nr:D-alanyl-D-alanine carboxypeptidase family protein [Anaerotignum sp.]MBQ7758597.1 D-alanyl-D-alanine carboxypeptidase [Anaerotignum sp.]